MDTRNALEHIAFGSVWLVYGLYTLSRKQARIGLGRPPLFTAQLDGIAATLFSGALIAGSLLLIFPALLFLLGKPLTEDIMGWATPLALVMYSAGIFFSFVIQMTLSLGAMLQKRGEPPTDKPASE